MVSRRAPLTLRPVSSFAGRVGVCVLCVIPKPLANLIITASGLTICPTCRYLRDAFDWTHQQAVTIAPTLVREILDESRRHGLVVVDGGVPSRSRRSR